MVRTQAPVAEGPGRPTLFGWTLEQFAAVSRGLLYFCGGGIFAAMLRRKFAWRAWAGAMAIWAVGLGLVSQQLHALYGRGLGADVAQSMAWGLGCATLAGFVAASICGSMAFYELQLSVLVAGTGLAALLMAGIHTDTPWQLCWGERLFGGLWDRLLGLFVPLAFLLALVGASLALFARGMGSRRAPGGPGIGLAWRLAQRHMAGRARFVPSSTAVVAVLGIALGVAALVATTAVMSGYQEDIRSRILGTNAHLVVQKYGVDFTAYREVIAAVEGAPGVVAASPFAFNEAMLAGAAQGSGVLLKGIDAARAARVTDVGQNLCASIVGEGSAAQCVRPAAPEADAGAARLARVLAAAATVEGAQGAEVRAPPPLLVGLSLFQRLGLPLGSRVRLMTPVGMAGSRGNAPRRAPFVLAGVFSSGMHEFDSRLVYTSLAASQHLLGMGEAVSGVELRLEDPYAVDGVARDVLTRVGRYPYRTLDWRQLNAGIFTALTLQKVVMFLVLAFIVVVASFNVASTLFMAIAQKSGQVAVLRAMGAPGHTILQTFLFEGWLTGVVGCALGLALGLFASWALGQMQVAIAADVYMVNAVRIRLDAREVGLTALCTLIICHLAALVPALGAAQARAAIDEPGQQG